MNRRTGELLFDKIRTAPPAGAAPADPPIRSESPSPPEKVLRPAAAQSARPSAIPRTEAGTASAHSGIRSGPLVVIDGGRLNLSLTSSTGGMAAFALVLLIAAGFMFGQSLGERRGRELGFKQGRDSYSSDAIEEIEQARAKPPRQDIVANLLTGEPVDSKGADTPATPSAARESAPARSAATSEVAWVEGYNYIVVQEFEPDAVADAQKARDYLLESQIPTVVVHGKGGRLRLVTVEGFNFKEQTQRQRADLLRKRIADIGGKFFAAGGRYRLEGYYAAYKSGAW